MSLHEYARKRRFDRTPEPAGAVGSKRGRRPIFVVQLHHASVRHYDFRLEMDGALKSWAVPKGPSLRVGEKRLAVQVEDHPLEYATFAGDIPAGHYGAGHVDVFDHGVWSCDGDPLEALAAGKIDFVLHGSKLGGGWKLIRTAKAANKPQWLLLKHDDEYAADAEADDLVDTPTPAGWKGRRPSGPAKPAKPAAKAVGGASSGTTSRRGERVSAIAATATTAATPESARATTGPSPTRLRKVDWRRRAAALDGARPLRGDTGCAPQLATLRGSPPTDDHWLHELKWDGYRLLARIDDDKVSLRSRNGLDWTADYPEIVAALEALGVASTSLDGELIALDDKGRNSFSALQRTIEGTANASLRYVVFDLPSLAGVDLTGTRLDARKALLEKLLTGSPRDVLVYSRHVIGHGAEVFAASLAQGMEGIISKAVDAPYTPGRSSTWLKIKHAQTDEFIVVGFTAPKGSRVGFGSLLVATRDAGLLKYVGRVGTGFDEALLRELTTRLRRLSRDEATVSLPPHVPFAANEVTWVAPELVVEVAFRGWGKEGLLRQASYQRMREDKDTSDVEVARMDSQDMRDQGTTRLSSPDKLIYPAEKITKQQVADYYRAVAARLLPEVVRRPLSLLRCPEGVQGQCFFQKHHAASLGERVHAVTIKEKDGAPAEYVYIDDLDGLIDLVQMNVLELHPWGARIEDVEHPDRLVFDLDPGDGVPWSAVRAGARDVRARLDEVGMASFLRLSGGKGVHVVVPIAPGPGWSETKAFCEAFADAMATQSPDRYVATASKAKRGGVIFIDWLRNSRGATSVASWSLRARPGAAVAMPLAWDELGRSKSGADYPMPVALSRSVRLRGDPWEGEGWQAALGQQLTSL